MNFTSEFGVGSSIHHMILSENVAAFLDNETVLHFINPSVNKSSGTQQFGAKVDYAYYHGNSSSEDGRFLCLYFPEKIETKLFAFDDTLKEYTPVANLEWSTSNTEVSHFSADGSLLAVGGNNGQVCIYRTDNGKLLTIAPRLNEYISAVCFNRDGSLISYASFKKTLIVFDLSRFTVLSAYGYKEVICALAFMHKTSHMIVGARDNKVFIFDPIGGFAVRDLLVAVNRPMAIYIDTNDQYCFISDKAGYLYLLDLTTPEPDKEPIFNSKAVIVDIKKRGESIYFAFENGKVGVLDLAYEREAFKEATANQDMSVMYDMMRANPILKFSASSAVDSMDSKFAAAFEKAVLHIAMGNNSAAEADMGKLLTYPVYKNKFDGVIRHASKVVTFWQLIQNGQYPEAYKLAQEGDFYTKLPLYDIVERRYQERFKEAIRNLNSAAPNPQKAKDDLQLFSKVPSKDLPIKNMLRNPEIFNRALNAFEKEDWHDLSALIDKFKMLKGSPIVLAYQDMIKTKSELFLVLMGAGKYEEAKEIADFLKENASTETVSVKAEFEKLEIIENFREIVKNKQYGLAMETAIKNPFLISSRPYKELDEMLTIRFRAAHLYAIKCQFEPMDKMLRPFIKNTFTQNRAISVYKALYLEQIRLLGGKMAQPHWINALKNYVCRFGVDSELEVVVRKFDQDKLLEPFRDFSSANFLRYPLITNIVTTPFHNSAGKPKTPH
ncbi:MAG: hypothetical protein LBE89_07265 [Helicobacteraceae bacterium]|jgi:hypothetical protein|nr:hypothetical protein [Helicobacteraceae bacterium]